MSDLDDVPLKNMIKKAIDTCTDSDLLDLIYKLIVYEAPAQ
jgi:hypothetical protein